MILFYFYHPIVKYTKQSCLSKKREFTSGLKEIVSREGALTCNSRAGTDAQADEG